MMGAAIASFIASSVIAFLQVVQIHRLEGIRWSWIRTRSTYVGIAVAAVAVAWLWDPAGIDGFTARVATAAGLIVITAAAMAIAGHPELRRIARFRTT